MLSYSRSSFNNAVRGRHTQSGTGYPLQNLPWRGLDVHQLTDCPSESAFDSFIIVIPCLANERSLVPLCFRSPFVFSFGIRKVLLMVRYGAFFAT